MLLQHNSDIRKEFLLIIFCSFVAASISNEDIEALSYKSIKAIHKHLDDDQDGDVNFQESRGFMEDELKVNDKQRQANFHRNDSLISVDDLWLSWLQSEAHNWTTLEVVNWLSSVVNLPQYQKNFIEKKIDGRMLPRFTNEASSLFQTLGITNVKHRKKISLRATDIVLFGPQPRGYITDLILAFVAIFMTLAFFYVLSEKKYAKKQMEQMLKDVECMQQAEENLKNTQEKLVKAELEYQSTVLSKTEIERKLKQEIVDAKKEAERLHEERDHHEEERIKMSLVEQELFEVRKALQKAEAEMETMGPKMSRSLQQWLYITYRKESKHFIAKKANALKQLEDAKDACQRINKKRGGVFGSLRLVHGQSIDEVDQKILSVRSALAEVTNDLQERQHRWRQIEELCGFAIIDGPMNQALEIEEHTRKSSIARALAVCANLGGIGSIPGSVSGSQNISNLEYASSNGLAPISRSEVECGCPNHPNESLNESKSSDSNPVRVSPTALSRENSESKNCDDGLSFKSSSPINSNSVAANSSHSAKPISDVVSQLSSKHDTVISNPYDAETIEKSITREKYGSAMKKQVSESAENPLKFHASHSVPTFSSKPSVQDSPPPRSFSVSKATPAEQNLLPSTDSDEFLAKIGRQNLDKTYSSIDENMKLSYEDLLNLRKLTGSNEELSTKEKKISKKQKSKLSSILSKKPQSFDELSLKSESGNERLKKKSILSKLKKKSN